MLRGVNRAESPINIPAANCVDALRLEEIFNNPRAPLEVDAGCGDGAFLVAMAMRFPNRNFLGIERLLGRVRKTCRRLEKAGAKNSRVLRIESSYAVRYLIPRESVAVFHVLFPDPWPKRKHHRRRLINDDFLGAIHAALRSDGELRLTTDDRDYFTQMEKIAAARSDFAKAAWPHGSDYPQTDFEKHFRAEGRAIYRLLLRKI